MLIVLTNFVCIIIRPSSEHSSTPSTNPFASFTGFTSAAAAPKAPVVSNPFANFTGFTAAPTKSDQKSGSAVEKASESASVTAGDMITKKKTDVSEPSSSKISNSKLEQLNKAFLTWTGKQVQEHPLSIWTDGLKV